jgi:methionyl-tRNA synthetase
MVHFIGTDILDFHALFWPAMLRFAGYRTPDRVYAHGFLTVDGQKMSKSRGTFITAESYLQQGLNAEWLRYYYAAKLGATMEDIDLNLADFVARVNSDLVGKYVNIAARAAGFITKRFGGRLIDAQRRAAGPAERLDLLLCASEIEIAEAYERREYGKAVREIMRLADLVNQYADQHKPWELAKQPDRSERLHQVCSELLNAFRILTIYLKPILPATAARVESLLNLQGKLDWQHLAEYPRAAIGEYEHLMTRADTRQIEALVAANRESLQPAAANHSQQRHAQHQENIVAHASTPSVPPSPARGEGAVAASAPPITIDDFMKVELRVARIVDAQHVEGAEKLLKLQLDIGHGETRQVFAGIKSAYDPEKLKGRLTVMAANLQPRKMRFGESQGMVLAASGDGPGIFLLAPDDGAQPGMRVK